MRVSYRAAFMCLGNLVEYAETSALFTNPVQKQTEDYIISRSTADFRNPIASNRMLVCTAAQ